MREKRDTAQFRPLTANNWNDLEKLFGPRGGCAGCWCMYSRLPHSEYESGKGEKNRRAFRKIVASGAPTGVLAYLDKEPVGWCGIAPRTDYPRLARSRVLQPVDNQPVWSVTCFYVTRAHRGNGLSKQLLQSAVEYARTRGAKIVEGYPHDSRSGKMADAFAWTGFFSAFRNAGFKEVARRSTTRPIVRLFTTD